MPAPVEYLVRQADPANLALMALVWWRLDRRMRQLRSMVESQDGEGSR